MALDTEHVGILGHRPSALQAGPRVEQMLGMAEIPHVSEPCKFRFMSYVTHAAIVAAWIEILPGRAIAARAIAVANETEAVAGFHLLLGPARRRGSRGNHTSGGNRRMAIRALRLGRRAGRLAARGCSGVAMCDVRKLVAKIMAGVRPGEGEQGLIILRRPGRGMAFAAKSLGPLHGVFSEVVTAGAGGMSRHFVDVVNPGFEGVAIRARERDMFWVQVRIVGRCAEVRGPNWRRKHS